MAKYDGSIRINTEINTKDLKKGEADIRGSFDRMMSVAKKFTSVIATAFITGKIAQFGKEANEAAADMEAMDAQFSQVFGDMEKSASASLSRIANQAGILEERMKGSYTKIAAFAKTTGMDTASSMELANRAMVVVADSAAFYDRSLEDVTESLQSFLKGNYENDAALGLSATEFTRNAAAMKNYGKKFNDLTEAQKQMTLLNMVEDANRLSGAMGQAARESDTWTNQIGNLAQAWTNLKANIGQFILPFATQAVKAITSVINSINAMLSRLATAAGAFRSFSELLTGKKASAGSGIQDSGMGGMESEYNGAADAANGLADATEGVADATKNAAKAAKGYLSPLDKLNNISKATESSASGGAGGGIGGGNVDFGNLAEGETLMDDTTESTNRLIDKLKELAGIFKKGFFDGLGDWEYRFDSIKNSVLSIKDSLIDIFADPAVLLSADKWVESVAYTLGSFTGSVASIGFTIAANILGGISTYLEENKDRIKNFLISVFDIREDINYLFADLFNSIAYVFEAFASEQGQEFTANIIGIFSDAFMGVTELASKLARDILGAIVQPFTDNKEEFRMALEGYLGTLSEVAGTIKGSIDETFDKLNEVYDEHFKPFFDSISNGLSDTVGKFMEFWNGSVQPILDKWAAKFDEVWKEHIQPVLNKVIDLFGKVADNLKEKYEQYIKPVMDFLIENVLPIVMLVVDEMADEFFWILGIVGDVVSGIIDVLSGVIDFLFGAFTGDWEKAWNGIVDAFKGIFNLIPTIIEGIINTAIDIINGIIGGINTTVDKVPALGNKIPNIPEIEKVSIPRLATGTVVPPNREFLAVLGDNKREPEVVSPLSTIEQAVENAMSKFGGLGGKEITIKVPVIIDGRTLIEIVAKYDKEHFDSTGEPLFSF